MLVILVGGLSLAGIVGSSTAGSMDGMDVSFVRVVCCNVEVSTTSRSLVQRSPTEFGASSCLI
jgi:hypothetical protein